MAKNSDFVLTAENILKALNENSGNVQVSSSPIQILIEKCRAKFMENIGLESVKILQSESDSELQVICDYIHQKHSPITGKIGALVKLQSSSMIDEESFKDLGNKIAKQIVALNDQNIDCDKLLKSEYLFSSVGTVKNLIASQEEAMKTEIALKDIAFAKIK